ncbi:MAG: hypothetical protein KA419_10610 [Acidobacteria bacterium]|nr:hypothetical protein [Acidobacteriota bacterium]
MKSLAVKTLIVALALAFKPALEWGSAPATAQRPAGPSSRAVLNLPLASETANGTRLLPVGFAGMSDSLWRRFEQPVFNHHFGLIGARGPSSRPDAGVFAAIDTGLLEIGQTGFAVGSSPAAGGRVDVAAVSASRPGGVASAVTYPFELLAAVVDDGWMDSLDLDEGNPFTMLLSSNPARPTATIDGVVDVATDVPTPPPNGQADPPANPPDPDPDQGTTTPTDPPPAAETHPEVLIYNGAYVLKASRLDDTHFQVDDRVMSIQPFFSSLDMADNCFLLMDDMNDDRVNEAVFVGRNSGRIVVLFNPGYEWTGVQCYQIAPPITSAGFMRLLQPLSSVRSKGDSAGAGGGSQLLVYSSERNCLTVFSQPGGLVLDAQLCLPMPSGYDGMACLDVNGDGFEDLAMLSMARNAGVLLLNDRGAGFQPSATQLPIYQQQVFSYAPAGGSDTQSIVLFRIGRQAFVYTFNPLPGVPRLLAVVANVRRHECLVFGDFNRDGVVDTALAIAQ